MSEITISAEIRKQLGKKVGTLRTMGKVPGIYYGHGQANIPIALAELTLHPLYRTSATHIINLKLDDGSTHTCILRAIQFDPVTDRPIHFDLFGLNPDEELNIDIPITIVGTAKGVKDGGMLQHIMHKLAVECLPKHIPDHIEVNVENLDINHSIHVRDLSVPNVKILENENSAVVAVVPPTVLKEPEPTAAAAEIAAPAEPEVIGKGKKTEEGEEGAPAEKEREKK